ncbi:uracil-DNA glycosylase [Sphingomonas sp. GCM10030256]|uniref:uracil-DNA glycosylase n=1 Tax=Sphingomonas sp. GCM10030256 TaxID=3273427 RepID=UPI003623C8F7
MRDAASLLGWWLEAGVDTAVGEQPRQWLKPASPAPTGDVPQAAAGVEPVRASLPPIAPPATKPADTLEAFHSWLRESSELPLFRAGAARALPHGPAEAEIMLVAGVPEREDIGEGRPIAGEAWALAERMLSAIAISADQAYVASLSCFPAPGTRMAEADAEHCAETMRHHIALVRPKRLLLLGEGPAKALTGQSLVQARGRVHRVAGVPAVVTFHPRMLLGRPSDKAHAWRDLLLLMSEEVS